MKHVKVNRDYKGFLGFLAVITMLFSQTGLAEPIVPNHAVIFMYHHVADDTPESTSVSVQKFKQQLDYLENNGYQVTGLDVIIASLKNRIRLPEKTVAITFDDAYISVYTKAFPQLKKRGWPFTVFVPTEPVERGFSSHANWEQLREMAAQGAIIANHSHTHAYLASRRRDESRSDWERRIKSELETAEALIREHTGQSHKILAYPYGEFTPELQSLVAQEGYIAFGQHSGPVGEQSDFLALPRFPVGGNYTDMADWVLKLNTLPIDITVLKSGINPLPHTNSRPELVLRINDKRIKASTIQCYGSGQGQLTTVVKNSEELSVQPGRDIPVGRSRYNCTAPGPAGVFYWYSHPWIRLKANGEWLYN